jgi:predicted phosphodiesterase
MGGIDDVWKEQRERRVRRGLERSYGLALELKNELAVELDTARFVIFSDQHRGARDSADDFERCEKIYSTALQHYLDSGYTLIVLGDAEELWKYRPRPVVDSYADSLRREAEFHKRQRYVKISGNHDDFWERSSTVEQLLGPLFGPDLIVRKNLRLLFRRGQQQVGELFLVHGHQGDYLSDQAGKVARLFVRYVWRPIQRITKIGLNTPAKDTELSGEHNIAMYRWAKQQKKLALIAGHTHEPVFESQNHLARLEARLASAQAAGDRERAVALSAELERRRAPGGAGALRAFAGTRPCYFNTGCCAFNDGDITGIEIADEAIRLVRWPDDDGRPGAKVLQEARLPEVFSSLSAP